MARVLIVGCGCRGLALAAALRAEGHAVRGTSRRPEALATIEEIGAEAALADPDRLATLMPQLDGVGVVCWLMGTAPGEAVHGPRLESLLAHLVDTPVRAFVYEAGGTADPPLLRQGAEIVARAGRTHRIRTAAVEADPEDHPAWLAAFTAAIDQTLSG